VITRNSILVAAACVALSLGGCAIKGPRATNFDATLPEEVPIAQASNGSIYQAGHDLPLFENATARRVGDTITINLVENTTAQKTSSTTTAKKSSVSLSTPSIGGKPIPSIAATLGAANSFDGAGDSALSNKLQGSVTVTVAKRLANGNLVVRGQKWIGINQGREYVRIQGIVRPIDVQSDNTIPSYKVADATISYGGQGALADANQPGLLARFFNSKWNPF
jgi:flagellar L-ring protein precursor FlgH